MNASNIGLLAPKTFVNIINFVGIPLFLLYLIFMFVKPWFDGNWDWLYVQNVWDRWQSLNVGMLALISSLLAFNIANFNANAQRKRDFIAAKAFLPSTLSEICEYLERCAAIYSEAWDNTNVECVAPTLSDSYKQIFSECIKHSDSEVSEYLTKILVWMQVNDARIRGFCNREGDPNWINPRKHNILTYLFRLGELRALVNKIFDFARSMSNFDNSSLEWEDFRNAYGNLDITIDHIHIDENMNLESFTKRAIERGDS